jgi:amidase
VVIPLARDADGLPIGAQLIGPRWQDERLLAIADQISDVTGGFRRPPGY